MCVSSVVCDTAVPWTVACLAPLSMEFSRQYIYIKTASTIRLGVSQGQMIYLYPRSRHSQGTNAVSLSRE